MVDLCATTGTLALPSSTVNIWGYTLGDCTGSPVAEVPGPQIEVTEGQSVQITLHNNLSEASAMLFQGQSLVPDRVGAPAGGTAVYTFDANHAGTYLYEAGLVKGAQHQVAMGLYGAPIVRPTTAGQAYAAASSAYDDEAVLILSEIDPALNASPVGFDLRDFKPKYWLINGKAYPDAAAIPTTIGNQLLIRYVNAGLQYHSMALLGAHQTVIAMDGNPFAFSHRMVAETFAPGQTADVIVTVPTASTDSKLPLYDGNLLLHNSNAAGFGGMLTFVTFAGSGATPTDTIGPNVSGLTLTPSGGDLVIDATVTDAVSNVSAAEYYIDNTAGTAVAMTGGFGSTSVSVQGTISAATLAGLTSGTHTVYVRGQDSVGNWGPFSSVVMPTLDNAGPTTSALVVSPAPTNGSVDVSLTATADDSATGNSNIQAAEYTIDGSCPSAPCSLDFDVPSITAPIAGLHATIPAATIAGLSESTHVIAVRSQDALGAWGAEATINLDVDKTGPTTSNVVVAPNPNDGTQAYSQNQLAVRLDATISDGVCAAGAKPDLSATQLFMPLVGMGTPGAAESDSAANAVSAAAVPLGTVYVQKAEAFIDTVNADGTGILLVATDGLFDCATENAYAYIPLNTIQQLSTGNHTIYVHGQDGAGNWGSFAQSNPRENGPHGSILWATVLDPIQRQPTRRDGYGRQFRHLWLERLFLQPHH